MLTVSALPIGYLVHRQPKTGSQIRDDDTSIKLCCVHCIVHTVCCMLRTDLCCPGSWEVKEFMKANLQAWKVIENDAMCTRIWKRPETQMFSDKVDEMKRRKAACRLILMH